MTKKGQSILGSAFLAASTAAIALPIAVPMAPAVVPALLLTSYIAADLGLAQFRKVFAKKPAAPAPK
jgi:hypothetical protein